MLVIVLCFYAAFAASVAIVLVRISLYIAKRTKWLRGRYSVGLLQVVFGISYMLAINFDAGPNARIDWVIAIVCGLIGGALSLAVALPVTKFLDRKH